MELRLLLTTLTLPWIQHGQNTECVNITLQECASIIINTTGHPKISHKRALDSFAWLRFMPLHQLSGNQMVPSQFFTLLRTKPCIDFFRFIYF